MAGDPRLQVGQKRDQSGQLYQIDTTPTKVPKVNQLISKINATKATWSPDNARTTDSATSEYTAAEMDEVAQAVEEVEVVDAEYYAQVNHNMPECMLPPKVRSGLRRKLVWEDRRCCRMYLVLGMGPILLLQRGDIDIADQVLKLRNDENCPRFLFTEFKRHLADPKKWPGSNCAWVYQNSAEYPRLVESIRSHELFQDWKVEDKGMVPFDFVAADHQIRSRLQQLQEHNRIDLATVPPKQFFSEGRDVTSVAEWVANYDEEQRKKNATF